MRSIVSPPPYAPRSVWRRSTISSVELAIAFAADWAFGDPPGLPHPVRWIGKGIEIGERWLYPKRPDASVGSRRAVRGPQKPRFWGGFGDRRAIVRVRGALLAAAVVLLTYFTVAALIYAAGNLHPIAGSVVTIYFAYVSLAARSLMEEAKGVERALARGDLEGARERLSRIVSRRCADLSGEEVARGAVESLAENTADGIVAPLFYLVIGGPPLAMGYKAVSTLDSMIGYRNDRYRHFGLVAARLDDLANFAPARLTALLIALSSGASCREALRTAAREGRNDDSPNSGFPIAAAAGGLGLRLGGPTPYSGGMVDKPHIGKALRPLECASIQGARRLMTRASLAAGILGAVVLALR